MKIVDEWDEFRRKHREEGDVEGTKFSKKERASRSLYGAISKEFGLPRSSANKDKVAGWMDDLFGDAAFNFESYADCFVSENLVRRFIKDQKIEMSDEAKEEASKWREKEEANKSRGNVSIPIRRVSDDSSYLDMSSLANLVDKKDLIKDACLARDAWEYKPMRDAVAHTALLSDPAKAKLTTVRENIKERVRKILAKGKTKTS